jgi:hypothetical protein
MSEKKVPFDYDTYAADRSAWKLYTRDGYEVPSLFKDDNDSAINYPLKGIVHGVDGAFDVNTWTLLGQFTIEEEESGLDITHMVRVKPEVKVEPRFIDAPAALVNVFLMPTGKLHVSTCKDDLPNAMAHIESVKVTAPSFKFLGTISLEQQPQVIELLLAEGFKLKS